MLKKIIFLCVLTFSKFLYAEVVYATLKIAPDKPAEWGYHTAWVKVKEAILPIHDGITLSLSNKNTVSLNEVWAMNVSPAIDARTCKNIHVKKGEHQLLFRL